MHGLRNNQKTFKSEPETSSFMCQFRFAATFSHYESSHHVTYILTSRTNHVTSGNKSYVWKGSITLFCSMQGFFYLQIIVSVVHQVVTWLNALKPPLCGPLSGISTLCIARTGCISVVLMRTIPLPTCRATIDEKFLGVALNVHMQIIFKHNKPQ